MLRLWSYRRHREALVVAQTHNPVERPGSQGVTRRRMLETRQSLGLLRLERREPHTMARLSRILAGDELGASSFPCPNFAPKLWC